jgi:hypothetical protein
MRELTNLELDYVCGGYDDGEDIVVIGYPDPGTPWVPYSPYYPNNPTPPYGGGSGPAPAPAPAPAPSPYSVGAHTVDISHLTAPLSPDQQAALTAMKAELANMDSKIAALPNNAVVTILESDGVTTLTVTGAQAKTLWASEKFEIDPVGTAQGNGSNRGASTDGSGVTHYNIDNLTGYYTSSGAAGIDYLLLHELSHNTAAGMAESAYEAAHATQNADHTYPDNEAFANGIYAAIANSIGIPTINTNYPGNYGNEATSGFVTPPRDGGAGHK